jgi:predicted transcriptional regulator
MKENDIDKIKAKLRLNEIDEAQRKELFKKFTDAGGKVISEREKRRSLMIDREKQKEHQRRLDEHHKAKSQPKGATELNEKKANLSPIKKTAPRLQEDPLSINSLSA